MIAILDVSAAIEIILKKSKKELFDSHYRNAKWVIAPDLFVSEISNVLWKYYKAKMFDCLFLPVASWAPPCLEQTNIAGWLCLHKVLYVKIAMISF
jgi:hypothetical protein